MTTTTNRRRNRKARTIFFRWLDCSLGLLAIWGSITISGIGGNSIPLACLVHTLAGWLPNWQKLQTITIHNTRHNLHIWAGRECFMCIASIVLIWFPFLPFLCAHKHTHKRTLSQHSHGGIILQFAITSTSTQTLEYSEQERFTGFGRMCSCNSCKRRTIIMICVYKYANNAVYVIHTYPGHYICHFTFIWSMQTYSGASECTTCVLRQYTHLSTVHATCSLGTSRRLMHFVCYSGCRVYTA